MTKCNDPEYTLAVAAYEEKLKIKASYVAELYKKSDDAGEKIPPRLVIAKDRLFDAIRMRLGVKYLPYKGLGDWLKTEAQEAA